jgi:hypothetical protein
VCSWSRRRPTGRRCTPAPGIEQKEINEAALSLFEIVAERVELAGLDGDSRLKLDVGGSISVGKETPASRFKQLGSHPSKFGDTHAKAIENEKRP